MRTARLATFVTLALALSFAPGCGRSSPGGPVVAGPPPPVLPVAPLSGIPVRRVEALPTDPPTLDGAIAFSIHLLEGGDLEQVKWASRQLGAIGKPAVAPLARAMTTNLERNPGFVRNILAVFSKNLPAPSAIDAMEVVAKGPERSLYRRVAQALGNTKVVAALPALIGLIQSPDFNVAGYARGGIAELPPGPAARALLPIFPDHIHPIIRPKVIPILARGLEPAEAKRVLTGIADGEDSELAVTAATELLHLGVADGAAAIRKRLAAGQPLPLEVAGLSALAEAGDASALPRLLELSRDPGGIGILPVIEALARYDDPEARARLEALVGSDRTDVRSEALYQLLFTGAPGARDLLGKLLASPERDDRILAALALARLDDPETGELLSAAISREKDPRVRIKLLNAAAIRGSPAAATAALEAMEDEEEPKPGKAELALNAAAALKAIPDLPASVIDRLCGLARDGIPAVRIYAVGVLGRKGRGAAVGEAITSLFASEFPDVRMAGARAWIDFSGATPQPLLDMASAEPSRSRARTLEEYARMLRFRR